MSPLVACRWAITAALALATLTARAACLPLPAAALRDLDARVAQAPAEVLRQANMQLASATTGANPLEAAQRYAVIAAAEENLDSPAAALHAVDTGLALLAHVPGSAAVDRVRLRLELQRTELQSVTADGSAARAFIDKALTTLPADSIERACALSQRAIADDFAGESDRAVADALSVHRLAAQHGWDDARIEAAYTLAVNFRRAGLYDQAATMIDEVVSLETAHGMTRNLPDALYERGKLLIATGRFAEARGVLLQAQQNAARNDDKLVVASMNVPLCQAALGAHDLAAAQVDCRAGRADMLAGQRTDLADLQDSYQAQLDLEYGHPAAALAKLDALIAQPLDRLLPVQESQIYRDRARALAALRRYREAVADFARAQRLDVDAGAERRQRQVAVLGALLEAEQLRAGNRLLAERMRHQQLDLAQQSKSRLLWTTLAVAAGLCCGLLAYLFLLGRRHGRRLRRYQLILTRAGNRAPHAVLLLDEKCRVCFANRCLLGDGPTPAVGAALTEVAPAHLVVDIATAVDTAVATGRFVNVEVTLRDMEGANRCYELFVLPAVDGAETVGVALQSIDVTDVRAIERELLDGNWRERRQMGGELHEGLAQELAGSLLLLGSLSSLMKRRLPEAVPLVTEIAEHIAGSIGAARQFARDLAPVMIERGSLTDALRGLVASTAQRLKIDVTFDCRIEGCTISDLAADQIYRFVRDAVLDAALRNACKSIRTRIQAVGESLVVEIATRMADESSAAAAHDRFSAKKTAFRVRLLGGTLRHDCKIAGEECITMTIPLVRLQHVRALASGS